MAKRKFNVGNHVRVSTNTLKLIKFNGEEGLITNTFSSCNGEGSKVLYYIVVLDKDKKTELYCRSYDIESIPDKKSTNKISDDQLHRMNTELSELSERMSKLAKFISSNGFLQLDDLTRTELLVQLDAMNIYYRVLNSRYNRLINSNSNVPLNMD